MGAFLSYSIVSGLLLLAMFTVYRLLMAGDNQHAYNRGVILAIYAVSFLSLPAINLLHPLFASAPAPATAETIDITATAVVTPAAAPAWGRVLLWVFIAGMAVTFTRTGITWAGIIRVIARGERIDKGRYTLVLTDNDSTAPFSWMHYMVMSRADYATGGNAIAIHELRHITCRHWIDLLIAQAVTIINWFNPAAWLMRGQLMLVHEYQADNAVLDNSFSPKEYQMLLIKKAVGSKFPSLANSLNHSKLKKRITMMYKSKSGAGARFKVLALAPAAVAALLVTSVPQVKAAISTIESSQAITGKVNNLSANEEISAENFKFKSINNNDNKTTVLITGIIPGRSLSVDGATFSNNGKQYSANGMDCQMTDGNATIILTFPFMTEFDDNCAITLRVNDKDVTFNLFKKETDTPSTTTISITNASGNYKEVRSTDNTDSDAEFYVDGKKIATADFEKIQPGDIAEITVNKSGATAAVYITLKK
ncbi:MAG: M56 family metallopeptidase [Muribaculaceae bacterium]|nr:M56 family metallopeptidase [Muribaculaceae bacterium]